MPLTKQLRSPFDGSRTSAADTARLAAALHALAHPSRLRIIGLIRSLGEHGEVCAADLTGPSGLSQPTVSHHLLILTEAGMVEGEQAGSRVLLSVADARLAEVSRALAP